MENKTDWSEKRFQIVLKLLNRKEGGYHLDLKQIEGQADELMDYLIRTKLQKRDERLVELLTRVLDTISRTGLPKTEYHIGQSMPGYGYGVNHTIQYIQQVIQEFNKKNDSGTN